MLRLKFALNLENLADKMIDELSDCWKDPFKPPVVIFPDPKLEQWFRLRWVQKKGVLANLNKSTIDRFLFDILVGDNNQLKKLSSDMLANVIISYLQQKTDGVPNYRLLGEGVSAYLENEGSLDENRLFDFANVMAGLFLEYETSRPSGFIADSETGDSAKGFLDCWKQGEPKDFFITRDGSPAANEIWQRKLYSAIFHAEGSADSLLTQVFKKSTEKNGESITYLTLPYLYEACKDEKSKANFHFDSELPVFIFGLSGMGQFYRVILQEFAKQHEIYAYIQNPCMAFWEDCSGNRKPLETMKLALPGLATDPTDESESIDEDENELLRYWGKTGRDNIKLWSLATDYNFLFEEESITDRNRDIPCDSLLHQVQWMIAHRKNRPDKGALVHDAESIDKDESFRVTTAPSKVREVEAIHSHICRLLSEKDSLGNPKATIADILVVSPNIDDYRTAIFQVFDQTRDGFHIPFNIVDSAARDSLTANALSILFSIREKGTLSRPDFFALVRNPVVQNVRKIHADEISDWEAWATNMNIYRDRIVEEGETQRREESWITATRRILLSRFSYGNIESDEGDIQPYSDISSGNDNSLYRFVDAIDSLESWMDKDAWEKRCGSADVSAENLSAVYQFLDSWLCMGNPPKELAGESVIYHSIAAAREDLEYQYLAGSETISFKCISQTLLYAARGSEYSCGNLFINGLTFMKFAPNRIVPAKYLFFMGADAANFPGVRNTNTLDLRKSCRPWPGDDSTVSRNRYAFLCELMSTSEGFFISYVNKDLQKDEDFYPSSIVNDIRGFLRNALQIQWPDRIVPLDETRPWDSLYTRREIRNKKAHLEFGNDHDVVNFTPDPDNGGDPRQPEQASIYQFKSFLKDPFEFRVEQMMQIEEEKEDPEKTEFEPITTDNLQEAILRRMILAQQLGVYENEHLTTVEGIRTYALSKGLLPKGAFNERLWNEICDGAQKLAHFIESRHSHQEFQYGRRTIELKMNDWTLQGPIPLYAQNEKCIHLIDTAGYKTHQYHFLAGYIQALALLCEANRKGAPLPEIYVNCYSKVSWQSKRILRSPVEAEALLEKIYQKMFKVQMDTSGRWERYSKVLPIDMVLDEEIKSYEDYIKAFDDENSSPWKYFAGRKLFEIKKVSGFTPKYFTELWNKEIQDLKDLTPDLWLSENDMAGDVDDAD